MPGDLSSGALSDHDVAAVEDAWRLYEGERPVGSERLGRRFHLPPARSGARSRDDGYLVEYNGGVFDEYRVGVLGQIGQPFDATTQPAQRRFVGIVFADGAIVVDGFARPGGSVRIDRRSAEPGG